MRLYVDKKTRKSGEVVYGFTYVDSKTKKRVRFKTKKKFFSREEAESFARSQEGFDDAMSFRIQKRMEWKSKYYDLPNEVEPFLAWYQNKAPNTAENSRYLIHHYIFDFFLNIKKEPNINNWCDLHEEFKTYLQNDAKTTKAPIKIISFSTKNHVIKTLNMLMLYFKKHNKLDKYSYQKCEVFEKHLIGRRNWEDVIDQEEFLRVEYHLAHYDSKYKVHEFFRVLYYTGMRFNELFGLPMSFLYPDDIENEIGREILVKYPKATIFGYIVLESQISDQYRIRNKDKSITRKPLKSRKTIDENHNRTIPIWDAKTWDILMERYEIQEKQWNKEIFGPNKIDYMLFEDLPYNAVNEALRWVYQEKLTAKVKTYHCCRHSRVTYLMGETKSEFLVRSITGHDSSSSFKMYNHIYAHISVKQKQTQNKLRRTSEILADKVLDESEKIKRELEGLESNNNSVPKTTTKGS